MLGIIIVIVILVVIVLYLLGVFDRSLPEDYVSPVALYHINKFLASQDIKNSQNYANYVNTLDARVAKATNKTYGISTGSNGEVTSNSNVTLAKTDPDALIKMRQSQVIPIKISPSLTLRASMLLAGDVVNPKYIIETPVNPVTNPYANYVTDSTENSATNSNLSSNTTTPSALTNDSTANKTTSNDGTTTSSLSGIFSSLFNSGNKPSKSSSNIVNQNLITSNSSNNTNGTVKNVNDIIKFEGTPNQQPALVSQVLPQTNLYVAPLPPAQLPNQPVLIPQVLPPPIFEPQVSPLTLLTTKYPVDSINSATNPYVPIVPVPDYLYSNFRMQNLTKNNICAERMSDGQLQIQNCNDNNSNQKWNYSRDGMIFNINDTSKCISGGLFMPNGAERLFMANCDKSDPKQKWTYDKPNLAIINSATGKCFDDGGGTSAGVNYFKAEPCDQTNWNQQYVI